MVVITDELFPPALEESGKRSGKFRIKLTTAFCAISVESIRGVSGRYRETGNEISDGRGRGARSH